MNIIVAWFKSKSSTSHKLAFAAVALATLITSDAQFREFLVILMQAHPTLAADIILFAGIIAKYSHSSSPAGTLATARAIQASPDAPTSSQVDAVTNK